ncbi:MAG: transporter substrate-binding domain-containing protein [Mangrovibacterium sp.]
MKRKLTIIISIVIALLIIAALLKLRAMSMKFNHEPIQKGVYQENSLDRILREGKVRVVVINNSIDYFSYKGRMMGFQYELAKQFCEDLELEMDLYVQDNLVNTLEGLQHKVYDFAAQSITITKERRLTMDFTAPLSSSEQVLVQRKNTDLSILREQLQLAGKTIVVPINSSYVSRLAALSDEIGDSIIIVQDSLATVETLIADVASGAIDYTVAHRDVAEVNKGYYDNIDIDLPISFKQEEAWIVSKGNEKLLDCLNGWLINYSQTAEYRNLYAKYYLNRRSYISPTNIYTNLQGGKLSPFDQLIKQKCEKFSLDWRLVASIIYNESNFDPEATSWVGAQGLMQVMPDAAETFRVESYETPDGNLEAGMRMLTWLDEIFMAEIPNPEERLKFVLASYNVGLGHVRDAQRLAEKYGKINIVWDKNVDYFLRNKSKTEYVNDPVVKYGRCRGEEPYQYVIKVLETYRHYCNLVPNTK